MQESTKNLISNRIGVFALLLITLSLPQHSTAKAPQTYLRQSIDCTCCSEKAPCEEQKTRCKKPSTSNNTCPCPCPTRCGANHNAGISNLYLLSKIEPKIPAFSLDRILTINTRYEYRTYKPPTPPPKNRTQEGQTF